MFEGLKENGEDTPLDHIPETDFSYGWFMASYVLLSNSKMENGLIPLSELREYANSFGLIGSFEEFVSIIYAMNDVFNEHRRIELKRELKRNKNG